MPTLPNPNRKTLATILTLAADFLALGVQEEMVLVVHASMNALGAEVNGGAAAVILALEQVLGDEGTLVMPTHTGDMSDPARWENPPVPAEWWDEMRRTMPPFDVDLTPTYYMGVIAETFRKQAGVIRSNHPNVSFAAWGKHARQITAPHPLFPFFGANSPLGRAYALDGWVLLLGVRHNRNSSLHLAEQQANIPPKLIPYGAPILVNGERQWVTWEDIDWDDSDFEALAADFARETGLQREGKVANADALLVPLRPLIDYGVRWLEAHRS